MNDIEKKFREHFNEPILHGLEVGRLIGYGEDACDCYLIIKETSGKIIWHTAVGGYIFLNLLEKQGRIPIDLRNDYNKNWNDLDRLDSFLEMNKCPKEKEFIVKITDENPFKEWEKMRKQNE